MGRAVVIVRQPRYPTPNLRIRSNNVRTEQYVQNLFSSSVNPPTPGPSRNVRETTQPGYTIRSTTPGVPGDRHNGNTDNNNNNKGDLRLSLDDRIELYNKTFDSNGNQLTLTDKHIVTKKKKEEQKKEKKTVERKEGEEHTSDIELYLSVESDRILKVVGDTMCSRRGLDSRNSSSRSTECTTSSKSLCIDVTEKKTVSGTCVICLVEYMTDDVIVLSETVSCRHVYHKECMVHYLASSAQEKVKKPLDVIDNPCPVCRRPNYCTVCDEDVARLLFLKRGTASATIAASSSSTPRVSPAEAVPVSSAADDAFSDLDF